MRIGELSKKTGIATDTLRYYEKEGLISPAIRSSNGYRQYNQDSYQQLQFINRAKDVGFTLKECRELLAIFKQRNAHTCEDVKSLTVIKLQQIEQRMQDLKNMHTTLQQIGDACCGGDVSAINCTILNCFESGESKPEGH